MFTHYFAKMARSYHKLMSRHTLKVQMVSGSLMWVGGDLISQTIEHYNEKHNTDINTLSSSNHDHSRTDSFINWTRVGQMWFYGFFIASPIYCGWYSWLDKAVHRIFDKQHTATSRKLPAWLERRLMEEPLAAVNTVVKPLTTALTSHNRLSSLYTSLWSSLTRARVSWRQMNPMTRPLTLMEARSLHGAIRKWQIIGTKIIFDCFLFDPLYLGLFFTVNTMIQQGSTNLAGVLDKLRSSFLTTLVVDIAVWAPIQAANFRVVPVIYQPLVVQGCNVFWNAYLSYVQHEH